MQQQRVEVDVHLAHGVVGAVGVVVHDPDLERLVLQLQVVRHLEAEDLAVPHGVEGLSAHLRLERRVVAQPDLREGVRVLRPPVHDGQVAGAQHAHLHLAGHDGRGGRQVSRQGLRDHQEHQGQVLLFHAWFPNPISCRKTGNWQVSFSCAAFSSSPLSG